MRFATSVVLVAGLAVSGTTLAQDSWYPSKYGQADEIGAANELSPAGVVEAAKLVETGKTYSLGVTMGRNTPAYGARQFSITTLPLGDGSGSSLGTNEATGNDDLLVTWIGIGSQLDGLGHLGIDHRYYNGVHVSEFLRPDGLIKFGTDKIPPIVTRGVLLDVAALKGVAQLPAGTAINQAELEAAARKQGVSIRRGDVVIVHTGWQAMATADAQKFLAGEPGIGKGGATWLASLGVVAVGADSWGVEVIPFEEETEMYPVHQILLAKNGIYLLENMRTDELVADRAWEFLFVLGQPKFEGAVQAPINPIAIR